MKFFGKKKQLRIDKEFRNLQSPELKRGFLLAIVVILAIAFIIVSQAIYGLFVDYIKADTSLSTGILSVELEEDYPFDDLSVISDEGAQTNTKVFRLKSTGDVPVYTRVKIIPVVEIKDTVENDWVVINVDVNSIELDITAQDWTGETGGYYYYKNILSKDDVTKDVTVKLNGLSGYTEYEGQTVRITIKVIQESAQVANDLWKSIFGITDYPQ